MLSDTNRVGQRRKQRGEPETTGTAGRNKKPCGSFVSPTGRDFSDTAGPKLLDTPSFKKR